MHEQNPSSSSHRRRRNEAEEGDGDAVACTGKSCQSCTAGVIADCVAVLCCPCAVVNIVALALLKLPWAMARKCINSRKKKSDCRRRRMLERPTAYIREGASSMKERVEQGKSERGSPRSDGRAVVKEEMTSTFPADEVAVAVAVDMYEVAHLGFGRVSFSIDEEY